MLIQFVKYAHILREGCSRQPNHVCLYWQSYLGSKLGQELQPALIILTGTQCAKRCQAPSPSPDASQGHIRFTKMFLSTTLAPSQDQTCHSAIDVLFRICPPSFSGCLLIIPTYHEQPVLSLSTSYGLTSQRPGLIISIIIFLKQPALSLGQLVMA